MRIAESELRQRYRDASDEELSLLTQQGPSAYSETAWKLLQDEMTRRGLPSAPVHEGWEPVEERPAVAPLQLAAREVVDLGSRENCERPSGADVLAHAEEGIVLHSGIASDASTVSPTRHVADLVFTGRGAEYFRIWVVNLLLTLLTLGVYSAWAKVRKARYLRQNTRLEGHVFDFHGKPLAIFRGRLVALVLFGAYTWAFNFSRTAGLVTVAALCAIGPWLFMRAQQFSLANTSFCGLRFGFQARAGEAYRTLLPILVLWLAPTMVTALLSAEGGGFVLIAGLAPVVAFPWMHHRLKAYQRRNATYGDRSFSFRPATSRFYAVYAKGSGLVVVGLVLMTVAIGALAAWRRGASSALGSVTVEAVVYGALAGLFLYVLAWPYYAARLQQVVWSRTQLGDIHFRTEIRALTLFRLVLQNVTLTVLTCGLYWPWAAIALARYRIQCVRVDSGEPLSIVAAGVKAHLVSAAGLGAADVFGLDIGL